jgi:hypothetical protein
MVKVQVTSGELAGYFIGTLYRALVPNPDSQEQAPVLLSDTDFALYAQERPATEFVSHAAEQIQKQLAALGIKSKLIGVKASR